MRTPRRTRTGPGPRSRSTTRHPVSGAATKRAPGSTGCAWTGSPPPSGSELSGVSWNVQNNDFSDGDNPDSAQPVYFGRPYQVHDGLVDITNASDLVTVSYNRLHDHDKTMLIGSTNTPGAATVSLNMSSGRATTTGRRFTPGPAHNGIHVAGVRIPHWFVALLFGVVTLACPRRRGWRR